MKGSFIPGIILFATVLFVVPSSLSSQTLYTLDDIAAYGRQENLTYRSALWEARKAYDAIESIWRLDETSLSVSGSWSGTASENSPNFTAVASLPVLDTLGFSASLDRYLDGNLGITINPLTHSDTRDQAILAYRRAEAYVRETAVSVENNALSAALNWMVQKGSLSVQEDLVALKERAYSDEKIRYDAGEATLDDVRQALLDWSEARVAFTTTQSRLRDAALSLHNALNADPSTLTIRTLDVNDMKVALEEVKKTIDPDRGNPSETYETLSSRLDAESIRKKLEHTRLFDPSLAVTGSLDISSLHADPSFGGTITLAVSLKDFQGDDRAELMSDFALAQARTLQVERQGAMELEQAMLALDNAKANRRIVELELEETLELLDEADFLFKRGSMSALEREETVLLYRQTENELFSALADEYNAWTALKQFSCLR